MNIEKKGSRTAAFSISKGLPTGLSFSDGTSSAPLPGLAASATRRLPLWAMIALLALYIGHGLFHRDPWRGDDMAALALARSTAEELMVGRFSALVMPQFEARLWVDEGPLWIAIQAIFMLPVMAWSQWMGTPLAIHLLDEFARIPLAIAMALGFAAVWKAADRLARRREAQPIDPLGVGPNSRDFGKTLGDCALLLSVATLGAIYPWHQAGVASAEFLLQSLLLWALAMAPESPRRASAQCAIITTASLLTAGAALALVQVATIALAFLWIAPYRITAGQFLPRYIGMLTVLVAIWILAGLVVIGSRGIASWWIASLSQWALVQWLTSDASMLAQLRSWANDSLWKWWPLWPIAVFGLWQSRCITFSKAPQWALPLISAMTAMVLGLIGPREWQVERLAPVAPLAVVAAFSLLSLPRSAVNLIDWFAVTLFTALGIFIWLYWTALNFGFPQNLAARAPLLAPGVKGNANVYEVLMGVAATAAWIALVAWRIRRGSPKLWRPVVLSAGGLTLAWVLLMTLWLPAIDRIQGQRTVAQGLENAWLSAAKKRLGLSAEQLLAMETRGRIEPRTATSPITTACVRLSQDKGLNAMAVSLTRLPISRHERCTWRLALVDASLASLPMADEVIDASGDSAMDTPGSNWAIRWRSSQTEDKRRQFVLLEATR